MKELKTPTMRRLLAEALKKAGRPPSDGMMLNLVYKTLQNGWHYQVEFVHDTRRELKPYVVVYAFKPPCRWHARSADYYLQQEVA